MGQRTRFTFEELVAPLLEQQPDNGDLLAAVKSGDAQQVARHVRTDNPLHTMLLQYHEQTTGSSQWKRLVEEIEREFPAPQVEAAIRSGDPARLVAVLPNGHSLQVQVLEFDRQYGPSSNAPLVS